MSRRSTRSRHRRTPAVYTAAAAALAVLGALLHAGHADAAAGTLVVTAAGTFQTELGCASDWAPDCLTSQLTDPDGDGTYTWRTTAVPAGTWAVKATVGASWAENYGADGSPGGANIPFTVAAGAAETFSYNSTTHRLTVTAATDTATPTATPSATTTTPPASSTATLGAIYSATGTTFRIWSPDSSNVKVAVGGQTYPLAPATLSGYTGIYQVVVAGDLKNQSYQFSVNGTNVRDPYAQMVNPGTTQGIVIDNAAIKPSSGSWAATPALTNREDSVVYELDVRDFTIDTSSGVTAAKRGKYLGLVQTGTTNNGVKTGIDHLKELGVTTVHLMPTYDFSSTVPNWGYDPLNYNVPEEQFSQFTAPEDRIREFKDLVNGFHQNGIRVVLDVVYNHTVSKDVLGGITSKYYTADDYSGTGNSLDDSQPMVSRMIRDSLEHWVRDYNVDGFRFDLLGVFHHTDVQSWGTYLTSTYPDRNLLLYGEPWMGSGTPATESDYVRYGTTASMQAGHIGVFNGAYRDAIKGGTKDTVMNYMAGAGDPNAVALGMSGSPLATKGTGVLSDVWNPAFAYDPEQTINYVSAHDDLNLYDKITYSGAAGGASGRAGQIDKFAVGLVLASQGIPFISEGDEFLHSKVVNGDYATAMNSYNASDAVNAIRWGDKVTNAAVYSYYRDVIALRKATPALRLTTWDAVHNQDATTVSGSVIVSRISSNSANPTSYDTVIVANPGSSSYTVTLPSGTWTKVLDSTGAVSTTSSIAAGQTVTIFKKN
jgi:pullulanase